jgi:hypothetical protein
MCRRQDKNTLFGYRRSEALEAKDPLFQVYGEMLVAACLNWQKSHEIEQTIFGYYTISDNWTFLQRVVKDFEADIPLITVENSRE